jgi:hypothetical protein
MIIMALFFGLMAGPIKTVVILTQSSQNDLRMARNSSAAVARLLKDMKSSETIRIENSGTEIVVLRTKSENGIRYWRDGENLMINNEILLRGVRAMYAETVSNGDATQLTVHLNEGDPLIIKVNNPKFETLVDDDNFVVPEYFDNTSVSLWIDVIGDEAGGGAPNTEYTNTNTGNIYSPVARNIVIRLATSDKQASIIYYVVNNGERVYVEGNTAEIAAPMMYETVNLVAKVVAADGIEQYNYTVTIVPDTRDATKVPDWLWGGCEAYRTYMAREFGRTYSASGLATVTFGDVRSKSGTQDFRSYRITELGEIQCQFTGVREYNAASCFLTGLPTTLGQRSQQLQRIDLSNNIFAAESLIAFKAKLNDSVWKDANCRNLIVVGI